ncbi:MAG: NAD-dependent epimerase/dehydratase family protein, partial [Solirubrobacteraceae bacterium]
MRGFVIGGSGLAGRAICRRLVAAGWKVDVVGRHRSRLPDDLRGHVRFFEVDREDAGAMRVAFGSGADLLVDCACFTPAQAEGVLPLIKHTQCAVMLSTKAVYADGTGRHSNSAQTPRFDGPISEAQATVAPGRMDYRSPEGYAANKVAAERILLDSALPVTVLRPAKIHGEGARPARTWVFVKRVLDGRQVVLLAGRGLGGDHTCAAANLALLVEHVAAHPGRRVLNIADPDFPLGRDIASCVAEHLGHEWRQVPLEDHVR